MNSVFFGNKIIAYNRDLAVEVGDRAATVLQQVYYWTNINKEKGDNYRDGYYWVYSTINDWHERDFYYWSKTTVARIFDKLEKENLLISANFNKLGFDKTKWYRINEEKIREIEKKIEKKKNNQAEKMLDKKEKNQNEKLIEPKRETPQIQKDETSAPKRNTPFSQNEVMENVKKSETIQYNNKKIKKENNTYNNQYSMQAEHSITENLKKQLSFYNFGDNNKEIVEKWIDYILPIYTTPDDAMIKINKTMVSVNKVKERFSKLTFSHINKLLDRVKHIDNVVNAKNYVLTALYNIADESLETNTPSYIQKQIDELGSVGEVCQKIDSDVEVLYRKMLTEYTICGN